MVLILQKGCGSVVTSPSRVVKRCTGRAAKGRVTVNGMRARRTCTGSGLVLNNNNNKKKKTMTTAILYTDVNDLIYERGLYAVCAICFRAVFFYGLPLSPFPRLRFRPRSTTLVLSHSSAVGYCWNFTGNSRY
jgi:hypothetical protein